MKNTLLGIAGIFLFFAVISCEKSTTIYILPMTSLLSVPEEFIDKNVVVVGFLGNESYDIYLTQDHARINDMSSALFLNLTNEQKIAVEKSTCINSYVEVEAKFGWVEIERMFPELGLNNIERIIEKKSGLLCLENNEG